MSNQHWFSEPTSYRMPRSCKNAIALYYDPTPNGRENADGSVSFSMRFPALMLTEYVSEPAKIAQGLAVRLNAIDALLAAAKEVMGMLEEHGASIVPHLLDTDMNAGQRLRDAIAAAEVQP